MTAGHHIQAFFILLISSITSLKGYAQNHQISGQILNETDHSAVVRADIYLKNAHHGTVSDGGGYFNLQVDSTMIHDTLVVSALGFHSYIKPVQSLLHQTSLNIILDTAIYDLGLIPVVLSGSPKDVVKKALSRFYKNYPTQPYDARGVYAEEVYKGFQPAGVTYCKVLVHNNGFQPRFAKNRFQYWPTGWIKPYKLVRSKYKLIFNRYGYPYDRIPGIDPGPSSIPRQEKNIFHRSLLQKKWIRKYRFTLESGKMLNGELYYIIRFIPKKVALKEERKERIRSEQSPREKEKEKINPLWDYTGQMIISSSDYSIKQLIVNHKMEYKKSASLYGQFTYTPMLHKTIFHFIKDHHKNYYNYIQDTYKALVTGYKKHLVRTTIQIKYEMEINSYDLSYKSINRLKKLYGTTRIHTWRGIPSVYGKDYYPPFKYSPIAKWSYQEASLKKIIDRYFPDLQGKKAALIQEFKDNIGNPILSTGQYKLLRSYLDMNSIADGKGKDQLILLFNGKGQYQK